MFSTACVTDSGSCKVPCIFFSALAFRRASQYVSSFSRFGHLIRFLSEECDCVGVLFQWSVCCVGSWWFNEISVVRALVVVFVPQVLSVRKISVADSYCNAFYFVLFFCTRLFVRSWACVLFRLFLRFFVRLFCRYFGHACIGLAFVCVMLSFLCICVCDARRCYLFVTTLRVHPAETRLTVYRRPYIRNINGRFGEFRKDISDS